MRNLDRIVVVVGGNDTIGGNNTHKMRILIGIFCRLAQRDARALLRSTMLALAAPPPSTVDYRFVACSSSASAQQRFVYDEPSDVLILNISNSVSGRGICGKHRGSIEFFIAVDTLFGDKFEWVAKTDIDVRVNKIVPIQY